jgi:sensor histidine kinase YesM
MAAMPLRQQVIDYVDQLDDERAEMVLVFTQTLVNTNKNLQNSKTPAERLQAAKALAELESMNFTPKSEISLDGRNEKADHLWRKYESLS